MKTKSGKVNCLGEGKGRSKEYGDVDANARNYLQTVFETPNRYLGELFDSLGKERPSWLQPEHRS